MTRILVTGASGLLGSSVVGEATSEHEVAATYFTRSVAFEGTDCFQVDLTDERQYGPITEFDPDVIIHCAALTDVDLCEREPETAQKHNVELTKKLLTLADTLDTRFVHVSTDAVFDGKQSLYSETDETNPINVYGRTKLAAERAVQQAAVDSVIVRTSIYGWNVNDGQSLAEWMLETLRTRAELPAFEDAYFSPIYTGDLSPRLLKLAFSDVTGVVHVAGSQRCSKLEFAEILADIFDLDTELIVPTSINDVDFNAPRGRDLSLAVTRAQEYLEAPLPTVADGLKDMRDDEDE
jgi:dTDP-4-dehydrorhamnose reductase